MHSIIQTLQQYHKQQRLYAEMFVKNEVSLWHRYPNDGWALGTHKSDPGQIIATLIHYLHLCTHKYLEISNNNKPGLYSNRVKHRNGTAGQSVPAM